MSMYVRVKRGKQTIFLHCESPESSETKREGGLVAINPRFQLPPAFTRLRAAHFLTEGVLGNRRSARQRPVAQEENPGTPRARWLPPSSPNWSLADVIVRTACLLPTAHGHPPLTLTFRLRRSGDQR